MFRLSKKRAVLAPALFSWILSRPRNRLAYDKGDCQSRAEHGKNRIHRIHALSSSSLRYGTRLIGVDHDK